LPVSWHGRRIRRGARFKRRYMYKMIKLLNSILISSLVIFSVCAQEYMPFETAEISVDQWQEYFDEVSKTHSITEKKYPDQKLVTYADEERSLQFAFTIEGHPAHPCWVTRRVIEKDGNISLDQIGFFAGNESEFAKLFFAYERMNENIRAQFRK